MTSGSARSGRAVIVGASLAGYAPPRRCARRDLPEALP